MSTCHVVEPYDTRHTAQMYATTQCPEKQRRPSEARTLCHHNSKAKLQATTWECVHHPTSEADDPPTKGTPHNRGLSHSSEGNWRTHNSRSLQVTPFRSILYFCCEVSSGVTESHDKTCDPWETTTVHVTREVVTFKLEADLLLRADSSPQDPNCALRNCPSVGPDNMW